MEARRGRPGGGSGGHGGCQEQRGGRGVTRKGQEASPPAANAGTQRQEGEVDRLRRQLAKTKLDLAKARKERDEAQALKEKREEAFNQLRVAYREDLEEWELDKKALENVRGELERTRREYAKLHASCGEGGSE